MTSQAPRRDRTAAENQAHIREQVKTFILEQGLVTGELLPTETALMERLGISRNPLREAIKALQALGIVEVRHGFGTYVGAMSLNPIEDGLAFRLTQSLSGDLSEVRNLLALRQALEVGLAEEVVAHFAHAGTADLEDIVSRMEAEAKNGNYFPDEDWAFHLALYEPLKNDLIIELVSIFWRTFSAVDDKLPGARYTPEVAAGWHRNLVGAIHSEDATIYAHAMKDHFSGIQAQLNETDED